ncbi:MAG: phosphomannomutase/phosphoglucomutase, partial [Bacteroidales bacterium]
MLINWNTLQNGSDIRGVATEGVPGEPVTLTSAVAESIAMGFVAWLSEKLGFGPEKLTIAVGRDSRISGPALMEAFISGLLLAGANAVECGLSSTPAMYMSTVFTKTRYEGAVMLTASHLPF